MTSTVSADQRKRDAREVAAFIAKGMEPDQVAAKVDLPRTYVEELTETREFRESLAHVGGKSAVERWTEYRAERKSRADLRTMVRNNMHDYFKVLNDIALDDKVKHDVRANTIKFLLEQSGVLGEQAPQVTSQELPPSFFTALASAMQEMDEFNAKHGL